MDYKFFLDLALILFFTKLLGIVMKSLGLPQVLGSLLAGILLGVTGMVKETESLAIFAAIGVNLIMFSAGMETNFKEIKKNGVASILITSLGVIVPLVFGFGVSWIIPGIPAKERWFFGVILTATSVGITVATLKELGVLHGKVGASIVTAAILDDIIGVVILAFFTADAKATTWGAKLITLCGGDFAAMAGVTVLLNVLLFFVVGVGVGMILHYGFKFLARKFPHTRRLSIFGLIICFVFAWGAEDLFGVAAITGSFLAGMTLSNMQETSYVSRRIDMSAYMLFSPIFFANIGIGMPFDQLVNNFSWVLVGFSVAFVVVGLLSKFIGCGIGSAICKYKPNQCVKVGVGMMVRGEVCLIVAQTGQKVGLIQEQYFPAIILLIITSSVLVPIILKMMFKKYPNELLASDKLGSLDTVVQEQAHLNHEEITIAQADELSDEMGQEILGLAQEETPREEETQRNAEESKSDIDVDNGD